MQHAVRLPLIVFVSALGLLSACASGKNENHTLQGGLWDQVFNQAMTTAPAKSGE